MNAIILVGGSGTRLYPVTQAVVKQLLPYLRQNGGRSFYEYAFPRAILKFKQGFGRFIRSRDDIERVIICDERIEKKVYG